MTARLTGSPVSAFYYADKLFTPLTTTLIYSISTVLFPKFSQEYAATDQKTYRRYIWGVLRSTLAIILPMSMVLAAFGTPIVRVLIEGGNFDAASTAATGAIFTIYNTGPFAMKWEYKAEMRLKAMLQTELCQCRLPGQYQNAALNAIVFGRDMEQMLPLMNDGGGQRDYFVLDGNYQHFYYLTSDHHGELILQLFCDAEQQAVLDAILSQDLSPCRSDWVVENDAMDGNSPVLFAYTCDMPRIKRFDTALELHGKTGTLFCFDFQEDALQQVCGQRVKIESLDFEKVKALLFDGDS